MNNFNSSNNINKKLKIAIISDAFYPMVDGVVRVIDNYARELNNLDNIDVTLVVPRPRKTEDFDKYCKDLPYKVLFCGTSRLGFDGYNKPILTREFKKQFSEAKLDLIHCHSVFNLYKFAAKISKKQNIPLVLTVHSQYRPDFKRYLKLNTFVWIAMKSIKRKLNKADLVFSINEKMDTYVREIGYKGKSRVVRNATHFTPPANLDAVRAEGYKTFDIEKGANVFSFVGRLLREKGIFIILRALAILKNRGMNFKMIYVGWGFDEKALKDEIEKLGLTNDVILTGKLDSQQKIVEVYAISKLFLFPSKFDVDCLVKREAASCLVPTVFLENTYTSAEVTDGVNGYISAEGEEAFAEKIAEALHDEKKRLAVAEEAKRTLVWSWQEAIAQVIKIYEEILN